VVEQMTENHCVVSPILTLGTKNIFDLRFLILDFMSKDFYCINHKLKI